MLSFLTDSVLPIEAATTMGVSVKEDGAIGKFGTGLKYAIAGILRLNGSITITIDGSRHEFTAEQSYVRGRSFEIVHHNGQPCGFTTELGKHWKPWQLFRELASNTLDEGGSWTREDVSGDSWRTIICVDCREVSDAERNERVFLNSYKTLIESSMGATIHEGPSRHYYYKGIRAGSFPSVAPVTVDVSSGELSEDRMLDLAKVQSEMGWAFHSAAKWDESTVLAAICNDQPGSFWVDNLPSYTLNTLPSDMMQFLAERRKFVKHPAFKSALDKHMKKAGHGKWEPIDQTERHAALIAEGERVANAVGVDPIPRERVHFTRDLGDDTLAVTCMDTRHVWFSTQLAMLGRDEFMAGYIEEAMHAMTGFSDCTRELQNALLAIVVRAGGEKQECQTLSQAA